MVPPFVTPLTAGMAGIARPMMEPRLPEAVSGSKKRLRSLSSLAQVVKSRRRVRSIAYVVFRCK